MDARRPTAAELRRRRRERGRLAAVTALLARLSART
jgi:hypothetical protein